MRFMHFLREGRKPAAAWAIRSSHSSWRSNPLVNRLTWRKGLEENPGGFISIAISRSQIFMNSHRGIDSAPEDPTLTAEAALSISRRITRACFHAGLAPADAEDVAQDIWEWLLRTGNVALAQEIPWLGAVAQNYIKRF